MWQFIAGTMAGCTVGVTLMCLFIVGGKADKNQVNNTDRDIEKLKTGEKNDE